MHSIADNLHHIQETIEKAAEKSCRNPHEIRLLAVSKTHPAEALLEAYNAGQTLFGENRVQEAEQKSEPLATLPLEWHLIGHLQTNKTKKAVSLFSLLHTVDSSRLAQAIHHEAEKANKIQDILLQINIAEETQKFGASLQDFEALLATVTQCSHLRCRGLMIIPPYFDSPELVRGYFRALRELGEQYKNDLVGENSLELSMGMSHDYPVAIEEGATLIRVGTAIFGSRDYA